MTVLLLVPLLAVALNLYRTRRERARGEATTWEHWFALFGFGAWFLSTLMLVAGALPTVGRIVQFTLFQPAQAQLLSYGFLATTLFAAFYHLAPRLLGRPLPSTNLVTLHGLCLFAGVGLTVFALAIGGIAQGLELANAEVPFMETLKPALTAIRVSTLGDLVLLVGNGAFLINVGWALAQACREVCLPTLMNSLSPATEVNP
jgi:cytochrome c oxidase cbb3-type subunit 1